MLPFEPLLEIPKGVWAIASHLQSKEEASAWMESAKSAQAWSFRLPICSERVAIEILRSFRRRAPFLGVHGRRDWAALCGADAIVEGSRSLPSEVASPLESPHRVFATHTLDELKKCQESHAPSAVFFGPIWETPSKKGILEPRGLGELKRACSQEVPVIALGGIQTVEQVQACRDAGVHGVAVLRAAKDEKGLAGLCAAFTA